MTTSMRDSRVMWAWGALTVGLIVAFLYGPAILAGGTHLGGTFRGAPSPGAVGDGFVAFWESGRASIPANLANLTDYWQRYHVAKAVIAAMLLGVLLIAARRLWYSYDAAGPGGARSAGIAISGALVSTLAFVAALVVMANVQGAVAPLSSLISLLPLGGADGSLQNARAEVIGSLRSGESSPVVDRLTSDFSTYHLVVAVGGVLLAVIAVGLSIWAFRARRRGSVMVGVAFGVATAALVVLVVANVGSAVDPGQALLMFFDNT